MLRDATRRTNKRAFERWGRGCEVYLSLELNLLIKSKRLELFTPAALSHSQCQQHARTQQQILPVPFVSCSRTVTSRNPNTRVSVVVRRRPFRFTTSPDGHTEILLYYTEAQTRAQLKYTCTGYLRACTPSFPGV